MTVRDTTAKTPRPRLRTPRRVVDAGREASETGMRIPGGLALFPAFTRGVSPPSEPRGRWSQPQLNNQAGLQVLRALQSEEPTSQASQGVPA